MKAHLFDEVCQPRNEKRSEKEACLSDPSLFSSLRSFVDHLVPSFHETYPKKVEENENLFFRIDEHSQAVEGKAYEADEIESEVESLLLVENLVEDRFANLICRGESDRLEVDNKLQEEETALVECKQSEVVD